MFILLCLNYLKSWVCVVGMVTSLQDGLSGVQIPAGARDFSLPIDVLTGS